MTGPSAARVVLATRNAHKVAELQAILAPHLPGVEVLAVGDPSLPEVPEVAETEVTFAGNALLKARAVSAATGLVALADDSGIAVDVLGGAPGIFSARWAGRHGDDAANLALLLAQVADVPGPHRGAAFVCAAALVTPDGREHVELGSCAAPSRASRAAPGASGTTRRSCRRGGTSAAPSSRPRRRTPSATAGRRSGRWRRTSSPRCPPPEGSAGWQDVGLAARTGPAGVGAGGGGRPGDGPGASVRGGRRSRPRWRPASRASCRTSSRRRGSPWTSTTA